MVRSENRGMEVEKDGYPNLGNVVGATEGWKRGQRSGLSRDKLSL